jgi:pimeloyl-ACP methyl ester carboxylesterase
MTVVLVHGVPETAGLWDPLRAVLGRDDVEVLSLPGFGCSRPEGFGSTKEEYVDWLVEELEARQGGDPIDLVGHDWGGGFALRLVSIRPELVRSYVTDAAGLGDVAFEWHEFAQLWQTPGAGEEFWDQQLAADIEERSAVFELSGVPHEEALRLGAGVDRTMADSILSLYRSAVDVGKEWGPEFADVPARGLVLVPSDDPFLKIDSARAAAGRAGASVTELQGVGHWWMLQDPEKGAQVLREFWATLT